MDRREFFKFVGTRHKDYVPQNNNNKTEYDVPWGVCAAGALVFAGFVGFLRRGQRIEQGKLLDPAIVGEQSIRPSGGAEVYYGGYGVENGDTVAAHDPDSIFVNPVKPAQTYERGNSAALQRESDMKSYDDVIDKLINKNVSN